MRRKTVAFLFLHEMQHQILHVVPILQRFAETHGEDVQINAYVRGSENLAFIQTFLSAEARARITFIPAESLAFAEAAERVFGRSVPISRYGFLVRIAWQLRSADVIISPETTSLVLKRIPFLLKAKWVFVPHGAGDRAVSFERAIAGFDHVLVPGEKTLERMVEEGVLERERAAVIGYPKFLAIRAKEPSRRDLFGNDNPVFLYNPHFHPHLSSWYDMGSAVLEAFRERPHLNLIVAPHVMMYRRRVQIATEKGLIRAVPKIAQSYYDAPNIHIDTGSQASVDMTYTRLADVYIGDVSSQVYEFIHAPRPMAYLNPNGHSWRGNPYFASWDFGHVFDEIGGLKDWLDAAGYESNDHLATQEDAFMRTFGTDVEASAERAAAALGGFLAATDTKDPAPQAEQTRSQTNRIFRNFGKLASGKVVAAVLSLAYLAIVARALGPEGMGYLVLAHAYMLIISQIARFQSWQAIIRFGEPLLAAGARARFKDLVRFTAKLDALSAVLAVVIALVLLQPVARLMEWPSEALPSIEIYCWAAPFLFAATPTGLLRLGDRFSTLSWQLLVMPGARFIGAVYLWIVGGDLVDFLTVWIISACLHGGSLWVLGWRALKAQNLLPSWRAAPDARPDPAWWPFVIKTNLSSTVELSHSHLPLLIVGAALGGAASGFFQLAINLTNLIAHPTNLLNEATFPELAKINTAQGRTAMRAVAMRSTLTGILVASPIVLIYILFQQQLAVLVGGAAFAPAGIVIAWMAAAQLARIASVVFESAVLALDGAGFVLIAQCVAAAVIVLGLTALLPGFGPTGAPLALLGAMSVTVLLYAWHLGRRRPLHKVG
ncbi:MAG: lipopolysaccharide biosynthesis protein [Pseudomonadota bacterium]